jgi:hypothetical protein
MIFPPNSLIKIQEITRGYKILDRDIDTWVSEGWFPEYMWHKGRRVWDSNKFNEFAAGSVIPKYKLNSSKKKDTSNDFFLILTAASAALILATIF